MAIKTKSSDRTANAKSFSDFLLELEAGLKIDEHALNDALLAQPELFYHVSKELALQISRRDQAKQRLAEIEASTDLDIRERARADDRKTTEKEIDAEKQTDDDVIEATTTLLELGARVGQLAALKDAYVQRSYVLKDMVALYLQNYYASDAVKRPANEIRDQRASRVKQLERGERE